VPLEILKAFKDFYAQMFNSQGEGSQEIELLVGNGKRVEVAFDCFVNKGMARREDKCFVTLRSLETFRTRIGELQKQNGELERKLQEQSARLLETQRTARTLMDAPGDTLFMTDQHGFLLDVNETLADEFDLRPDEMTGRSIFDFFPEESATFRMAKIREVFETGKAVRFEEQNKGTFRDTIISPIFNAQNEVKRVSVYTYDIAEQSRVAKKIERNYLTQELLTNAAFLLLDLEDFRIKINTLLSLLGKHIKASRVYLAQTDPLAKQIKGVFEWTAPGITESQLDMASISPREQIPSLHKGLIQNGIYFAAQTSDVSRDMARWLEINNVKSALFLPISTREAFAGWLALDDCNENRVWDKSEIEMLKTVSVLLSNAFDRITLEQELRESEHKFRNLFNNSSDAIFIIDFGLHFVEANQTAISNFGYNRTELLKTKAKNIILNKFLDRMDDKAITLSEAERTIFDYAVAKDGKIIPAEIFTKVIRYNDSEAILFIVKDISDTSHTEGKIVRAVIEAEEKEKKRFAKDLHDGLGPLLSSIKLYLSVLAKTKEESKKEEAARKTLEIIDEAIASIKEISNNMSPHVLSNFGLAAAIKSFCNRINGTKAVEIIFNSNMLEKRIDHNVEVILFRVAEEMVHNTIKHAKASSIQINLNLEANTITLIYLDDGVGFDMGSILEEKRNGMGLSNIFNRVESIRGKYVINTGKGKGMKAKIEVDLASVMRMF